MRAGTVVDIAALDVPIVAAPMAGGPSTPELAAAVTEAGGLGFLAAGYKTGDRMREDIEAVRALTDGPIGVNIFVPTPRSDDPAVCAYAERLSAEASELDAVLGEPRWTDDDWEHKLDVAASSPVEVVSFTFGCPPADVVRRLRASGRDVWVTVTTPDEATHAEAAGANALIVQGTEAGGHRGGFADGDDEPISLIPLLRLVRAAGSLPLVAAGGLCDGHAVAAALCAGAEAAQLGTAFLLAPEAGTSEPHRDSVRTSRHTRLTRSFSGRSARGVVNRFMADHDGAAPAAYPEVHYLTAPLRAAARERGDAEAINLWAGQAHALAVDAPAGEIVRRIAGDARAALARVAGRVS